MVSPMTAVSTRVSTRLSEDPRTAKYSANIEVSADRGMVTLTGSVPSEDVRDAAEEIARDTPGVISVITELKVEK